MLKAFLPLSMESHRLWVHDVYFNDCCHPISLGHKVCALVLGNTIEEEFELRRHEPARLAWLETNRSKKVLPEPLAVSPDLARLYETNSALRYCLYDEWQLTPLEVVSRGFSRYSDVAGKPGLIALVVGSDFLLGIPLEYENASAPDNLHVDIGLLKSWANMGIVQVSVGAVGNAQPFGQSVLVGKGRQKKVRLECSVCAAYFQDNETPSSKRIDCLWSKNVSIHSVETLIVSWGSMAYGCLCVYFKVLEVSPARAANKIKLLDITVL